LTAKGLLLLSGGIDSPVAGHLLQGQGAELEALHVSLEPYTDNSPETKARALAGALGLEAFATLPGGEANAELARADHKRYFVLSKRFMLRCAEALARERGATFLATGENLGQVSSQTLANLAAIDAAVALPVFRPLLGLDKTEIVGLAERLGTLATSQGPELCDVLGPRYPATRATAEEAARAEAALAYADLVQKAVAGTRFGPPLGQG
jgi:thiamine biosynthesis protein ThiI